MSGVDADLAAHLATGATRIARCWALTRKDDVVLGFTDHDRVLEFEGVRFEAASGMTASALQTSTGLSVDNAEATGALSHDSLSETDIIAGRFDGAEMQVWLVNWTDVSQRQMIFRGNLGELRRSGGAFEAELRGFAEQLNQNHGQLYQGPCGAILGDAACGFDLSQTGFHADLVVEQVEDSTRFAFSAFPDVEEGWFARGQLVVHSGAGAGLQGLIKSDLIAGGLRHVELWQAVQAEIAPGDQIYLSAGCDKRPETCKHKFSNFINFRGFPFIPGEDWLMSYPTNSSKTTSGGTAPSVLYKR